MISLFLFLLLMLPPQATDTTMMDSDEEFSLDEMDLLISGHDTLQMILIGDTLYFQGSLDRLPRKFVISGNDGITLYKQLPNDTLVSPEDIPAGALYKNIWTDARVNPYGISVDSIADSTHISMQGFILPHPGYITSRFGMRHNRFHHGIDLKVQVGDSIRCPWDGMVRIVGYDPRGYGHFIVIRHNNGLETVYGHLSQPLFYQNERIFAGEVLGLGGNTGRSTGSHLHWEIRYLGNAFNPEKLINFETGKLIESNLTPNNEYILSKKGTYSHYIELKQLQQAQYHKVRSGDTLSGIAARYHTKVSTLCKLNHIKETSILQIGQRIRVR